MNGGKIMGYIEKKDEALHLCSPVFRFEIDGQGQAITVGIYRYNGGPAKIGINRQVMKGGLLSPAKLGRITLEEAEYIFGAMNEAITKFKELK
jgi:hypothetical protein